jgi:pimeloyl-ACP methyl ester carboxylesterase
MPICNASGLRQAYRLEGRDDGTTLILSNSLGTELGMWEVMQRFFSEPYWARDEAFLHTVRCTFLSTDPRGYASRCAAIRDADFRASLARIETPTLAIGGTLDAAAPPTISSELLACTIPGARLVNLEAGHVSNIEQPESFSDARLSFMTARAGAA